MKKSQPATLLRRIGRSKFSFDPNSSQSGVALVFALVALGIVSVLGISNAKNSQFQQLSASAFARYLQTDATAESAVTCVIIWAQDNYQQFSVWVTASSHSVQEGVVRSVDADSEQGIKTENILNQAVTSKAQGKHTDCLSSASAETVAGSAGTTGAGLNNAHALADRVVTADAASAVKDTTYFCGWKIMAGSELGTYGTINLVSAGDAMINAQGGTKTISATVWEAFGLMPDTLYDEASGGYQQAMAATTDVICEV